MTASAISYDTYVKFSLEGLILTNEEQSRRAPSELRREFERAHAALLANYDAFVALSASLPRFDSALFERIFPRRSQSGELYFRVRPENATETIAFLELLDALPLAYRAGGRLVAPWTQQSEMHRIFPYTIIVQFRSRLLCRVIWCYGSGADKFAFIHLKLPDDLIADVADPATGTLKDGMFVAGCSPYLHAQTTASGRRIGLRFPKAYAPTDDGGFRLLTWRDIPLFRDTEAKLAAAAGKV